MEEIINSVMQSPENTNPNALRSQLQKISEGGSTNELNALVISLEGDIPNLSTDMDFNVAKEMFLNNIPVFFGIVNPQDSTMLYIQITQFIENMGGTGKDVLSGVDQSVIFFSDGSIYVNA